MNCLKMLKVGTRYFGKIHSTWSRAIGLSSRRLSRRTRYAPNDRLLKTLVVTMVDGRMEFTEFLREARRRYEVSSLVTLRGTFREGESGRPGGL